MHFPGHQADEAKNSFKLPPYHVPVFIRLDLRESGGGNIIGLCVSSPRSTKLIKTPDGRSLSTKHSKYSREEYRGVNCDELMKKQNEYYVM